MAAAELSVTGVRIFRFGDLVTDAWRVLERHPSGTPAQRKVYRVLGASRVAGKVRVQTWSHAAKTWSLSHTKAVDSICVAPETWPQVRVIRRQSTEVAR